MPIPFLSLVIPAFNEETRIIASLDGVARHLAAQPYSWEVILVDDGSTDETATLVRRWAQDDARVRVESIPHAGKGWAVRHGMLSATGEHRFMCDADLAMPIERLDDFIARMAEGYDIVIGSRETSGARRFNEPFMRRLMGRLFNWSVRLLAMGGIEDTQCGFKCFRGGVADELFALQRIRGWSFDVEILHLALKRDMRVLELPIHWYHQKASKVRMGIDPLQMVRDTILIKWNAFRGRYKPNP